MGSRTCFNSLPFSACASQLGYKSQSTFFWTFYLNVIFWATRWSHFPSCPAETQALADPGLLMGTAGGMCRLSTPPWAIQRASLWLLIRFSYKLKSRVPQIYLCLRRLISKTRGWITSIPEASPSCEIEWTFYSKVHWRQRRMMGHQIDSLSHIHWANRRLLSGCRLSFRVFGISSRS